MKTNGKGTLIGGIAAAAAAVLAFIGRMALSMEMEGIKSSSAAIVVAGSKQMSRSEYFEYASGLINTCTVAAVVLLILAAVLLALYKTKKSS